MFRSPDLGKLGDDVLSDAVAQVFVFFGAALIFEVQHGDRPLRRHRSSWRSVIRHRALFGARTAVRINVPLEALEVGAKLAGGLVTQVGIFLQRLCENIFQTCGQSRIQLRRRSGLRMQDAVEDQCHGRAGEGNRTRGHLIQHDPKRKQIRAQVQLFATCLFRGHVCHRSYGTAGVGEERIVPDACLCAQGRFRHGLRRDLPRICQLGEAKIQDFGRTTIHEENIRGLDVTVDDTLGVGSFEAVGDLNTDIQEFGYFDGFPADAILERLALEQLHGDERSAFELANIVNGANVGVIERGSSACFAAETLDGLRVMGNVVGKKLEGHIPTEAGVLGFVDYAHSATAQFFQDGVVGDRLVQKRGGVRHRPWSLPQRLEARKFVRRDSEIG